MGTLTTNRQVTTVAQATVATKVHQTLDVHLRVATQVTFDGVVFVDILTDFQDFSIRKFVDTTCGIDANSFADCSCRGVTDTGDICEGDWNPLCSRDVYAGNTCHVCASFSLRVRHARPFFHNVKPEANVPSGSS